jgi:hypothetical protein
VTRPNQQAYEYGVPKDAHHGDLHPALERIIDVVFVSRKSDAKRVSGLPSNQDQWIYSPGANLSCIHVSRETHSRLPCEVGFADIKEMRTQTTCTK